MAQEVTFTVTFRSRSHPTLGTNFWWLDDDEGATKNENWVKNWLNRHLQHAHQREHELQCVEVTQIYGKEE